MQIKLINRLNERNRRLNETHANQRRKHFVKKISSKLCCLRPACFFDWVLTAFHVFLKGTGMIRRKHKCISFFNQKVFQRSLRVKIGKIVSNGIKFFGARFFIFSSCLFFKKKLNDFFCDFTWILRILDCRFIKKNTYELKAVFLNLCFVEKLQAYHKNF